MSATSRSADGDCDLRYTLAWFPQPAAPEPPTSQRALRLVRPRTSLDVTERARRYLRRVEPAIAGQHGDLHTFWVCCRIVRGFELSDDEALAVLNEWNWRCEPPCTERELRDRSPERVATARNRSAAFHLHGDEGPPRGAACLRAYSARPGTRREQQAAGRQRLESRRRCARQPGHNVGMGSDTESARPTPKAFISYSWDSEAPDVRA